MSAEEHSQRSEEGRNASSLGILSSQMSETGARDGENVEGAEFIVEPSDPYSLPMSTPGLPSSGSPLRATGSTLLSSPLNYGTPSSLTSFRTPRSGVRTPMRQRPDIRVDKHVRQLLIPNEGEEQSSATPEGDAARASSLVIWGTDVVVATCKARFINFIEKYESEGEVLNEDGEAGAGGTIYLNSLDQIATIEEPFLGVNCAHLQQFDEELYNQLIMYPQEVIPTLDMAANEVFFSRHPDVVLPHQIQIRPYNAEKTSNMRSLNPEDIDRLITVSGMVTRTGGVIPELREGFFSCSVCGHTLTLEVDRGRLNEPTVCFKCNTSHSYMLVHNRSQFTDKQHVKLQETPDEMPAGQTPNTVTLFAYNDLVDAVQPGQKIVVTGIYRALPVQVNARVRNISSVYRTHVDVLHYYKVDSKRLHGCDEETSHKLTEERISALKALSERSDIYERLAHTIAPSIFDNEDIKKGILLQLFGGAKKKFSSHGRTSFRSEINILLCGDPGTSKSQLLSYVYQLLPKSQYTSGKGSSAVGLTAYVTKDPESRQLVLQTGALVLANNGVCCIDEFDKMNESTRSVLHEVMEQQSLSVAKAGMICQLSARTSILAAANPVDSQWKKDKTIIENISLPHTLLSRFDLIFLTLDPQSEVYDRSLAKHLVSLYYHQKDVDKEEYMDMSVLRDYIAYAHEHVHPKLSESASEMLVASYVEIRKLGSRLGQISAYPRQLESLIRLSEAHAKMRLSNVVEVVDVMEAKRLHREALKQSATDPLSGKIDVNILTTGLSRAARQKKQELVEAIKKIITPKGPGTIFNYQKLFKDIRDAAAMIVSRDMYEEALKELQEAGLIVIISRQSIKRI
ncbi:disc proliferation abnormal [Rhodnius prolixus]|uniref:DNA replication licensing factor MCM4 n=1 Tax=Rhodnius prolixus TaxID=13249 RepID=A0ABL0DT55_RHOPR